jgi:hypothetical protein
VSVDRALHSRFLAAYALAAATGLYLYFTYPFPSDNIYIALISQRSRTVYLAGRHAFTLMLFTTPLIAYSALFSVVYIFRRGARAREGDAPALPPYPPPETRERLALVVGELHHPSKPEPVPNPTWLSIPERGLFTGIAVLGAIGTGKTTCCMRPFAEQLFAYRAHDPARRVGGLVLEVKGDFCHQVRDILAKHGRGDDYVEIALDGQYRYNPLQNDLDAYALAYALSSLIALNFGKGSDPFWSMASTNVVKFLILLHRLVHGYVTLFDVYHSAINEDALKAKIRHGEALFTSTRRVLLKPDVYADDRYYPHLRDFPFEADERGELVIATETDALREVLDQNSIPYEVADPDDSAPVDEEKSAQFESVRRWYYHDWMRLHDKLRTSIVEGISVFLSLFDDNPSVKRVFCPPKECYDPTRNAPDGTWNYRYGRPLPSFATLIEEGKVCALNFPVSLNPGLAKALGTLMKMDFQRAVLLRIPEMTKHPDRHYREVAFICDEYQNFATAGEDNPNGDEKFFSLSRQPKCIPIVATQSVSSLKSTLPGDTYKTLLQTFRTKIFLGLSDEFSTKLASDLCGREDKPHVSYNVSESSQDAHVSLLTGRTVANKGTSVTASKSYGVRQMERFGQKAFAELQNAQAIVIPYDGLTAHEATYCYLKPYYLDPNMSWFEQTRRGLI